MAQPRLTLVVLALGLGCSTSPAPPDHALLVDARRADAPGDLAPRREAARPDRASDGATCKLPFIADCQPLCDSATICTEALGGRCAPLLALAGQPDSDAVLAALVKAMVGCWTGHDKSADRSVLCTALDTCSLAGPISEAAVKSWVCGSGAEVLDTQTRADARSIFSCGPVGIYRPDWKIPEISGGERGLACLSFHRYPLLLQADRLDVERCKYFRPFDY